MKQVYTSGDLPRQKKGRGYVWRKAYIFEIRTGRHDFVKERIVIELHSAQTRKWPRGTHASTEIVLNRNEAEQLVAGILAAMHDEEGAST
jgi:hypothetical protein